MWPDKCMQNSSQCQEYRFINKVLGADVVYQQYPTEKRWVCCWKRQKILEKTKQHGFSAPYRVDHLVTVQLYCTYSHMNRQSQAGKVLKVTPSQWGNPCLG